MVARNEFAVRFSFCLLVLCFSLADDRLTLPSNFPSSVLIPCQAIAIHLWWNEYTPMTLSDMKHRLTAYEH